METKKTVINQLIEDIKIGTLSDHINGVEYFSKDVILEFLERNREKEKEQIKQDFLAGFGDAYDWPTKRTAEEYYNETYGN
jgi:capsule polysaccharide modification protein KpsS